MDTIKAAAAYDEGFKNGRLDRVLETRSEYSYNAGGTAGGYPHWYGCGYRDGVDGRESNNPWWAPAVRAAVESFSFTNALARRDSMREARADVRAKLTPARAFEVNRLRAMELGLRERVL